MEPTFHHDHDHENGNSIPLAPALFELPRALQMIQVIAETLPHSYKTLIACAKSKKFIEL
jgi:hypothetical protein